MTNVEVYFGTVSYSNYVSNLNIMEYLNELYSFKMNLSDIAPTNTDISEGATCYIYLDSTKYFKGRVEKVTNSSSTEIEVSGYNMAIKLVNRKMDRYLAANKAPTGANSIFTDIISENQNGTGTNIMQIGTNTAYGGVISYRVEYDNRLRAVAGITNSLGWDWYVDWDGSDVDQINVDDHKGSSTSVFTFYTFDTGSGTNCQIATQERDVENVVNWVTLLGYGDGVNQISTEFFSASPVYTTLSANCDENDTTISCTSLSAFSASAGYFKIGSELVYGTKSTNDITGAVRGIVDYGAGTVATNVLTDSGKGWRVNQFKGMLLTISSTDYIIVSNTATTITTSTSPGAGAANYQIRNPVFEHYKGCAVFEYDFGTRYTPQSPKAASSITTYGIKEQRIPRKEIIHLPTLELLATRYLLNGMEPIKRIRLLMDDPGLTLNAVTIGDVVTVYDENTGFTGQTYRVVGRIYDYNLNDGTDQLVYEVNNKMVNFITDTSTMKENTDTLGAYMDGAVNIYQVNETENADSTHPVEVFFEVPTDAVAINEIKLAYRNEPARTYNASTGSSVAGSTTGGSAGSIDRTVGSAAWVDVDTIFGAGTLASSEFIFVHVSARHLAGVTNVGDSMPDFYIRLEINGTYYPNSTGLRMLENLSSTYNYWSSDSTWSLSGSSQSQTPSVTVNTSTSATGYVSFVAGHDHYGDYNHGHTASQSAHSHTGGTLYSKYPKRDLYVGALLASANAAGYAVKLQAKYDGSPPSGDTRFGYGSIAVAPHTHPVAYAIGAETYTTNDIGIYTTTDAATSTPTWVDRTAAIELIEGTLASGNGGVETGIYLPADWFDNSGVITGWKGIKIVPNGNSRHKASITVKCFVQSIL